MGRDTASKTTWRFYPSSLKGRLLLLAALIIALALALFSMQLASMFRQHVEHDAISDLQRHLEQLVVSLRRQPDGGWRVDERLTDPRFMRPLSGLYWQVNDADGRVLLRSRSLWDAALPAPPMPLPAQGALRYETRGPQDERLLALAQQVRILPEEGAQDRQAATLVVMVGRDAAELERTVATFHREIAISLGLLALVLLLALLAQVSLGLAPLRRLREQIAALRSGSVTRLDAPDVDEMRGLVEELNKLLAAQRQHVEQARARAGNLAHGLKTPLAALFALAREMAERGQTEDARALLQQAALLRQQVEHELSRARVRGDAAVREHTLLLPVLQRLLRTLRTLRNGERLRWELEVPESLAVRMVAGDVMELAGNLLENAAKWARGTVRVTAAQQADDTVVLCVEDDGPGVPTQQRQRIIERGVRLDEQVPGSGLGLAIVQEIVQAYEGRLELLDSTLGGLMVRVILPAASAAQTRQPRS